MRHLKHRKWTHEQGNAVVVAMADSLDSSIMCVMSAKELGVPKVIAKAKDEMMEKILRRVGADQVVFLGNYHF